VMASGCYVRQEKNIRPSVFYQPYPVYTAVC
jgi:hypothetical protein